MLTTRWIVGIDLSELSRLALLRALADASDEHRTELHVVHALDDHRSAEDKKHAPSWEDALKIAHKKLERFVKATRSGLRPEACIACYLHVTIGAPVAALLNVAEEVGATQIFVGTHGRQGVRHALLGSVAEEIVRRAPCPVLVVRACTTKPRTLEPEAAGTPSSSAEPEPEPHLYRYTSLLEPEKRPGVLL